MAKGAITSWSCDPTRNGFQTTSDYIIGQGGEQRTEMSVTTAVSNGTTTTTLAWLHTNVWAGGRLLGTYDTGVPVDGSSSTGWKDGLHFYFDDPLGTRRAQTDAAGVLEQSCVSLPYGDGLNCSGQPQSDGILYTASLSEPTENHFTGKERDVESGNDYFGARYYSSALGRFLSPDWSAKVEPVPYAKLDDPQSFNLYAYLMNNPLGGVDADGHGNPDSPKTDDAKPTSGDQMKNTTQDKPQVQPFTGDTVGPYQNPVHTCVLKGVFAAGADVSGLSILPDATPDRWRWSTPKLGFVYVEPDTTKSRSSSTLDRTAGALGALSDWTEKTADFFHATPHAKQLLRTFLKSKGIRVSSSEFSAHAGQVADVAGKIGRVVAFYDAYSAYKECRK